MAYEPLHHKYRPQTFAQLVGQDAIATTLANALRQQRIAPAYLFSGPRGTGKTSSARILAKSLNCINQDQPTPDPCGVCETCRSITNGSALDFIEIDAASNTGVDNIRELIERAQFAPAQCRYKVYVIDECLTGDSLVLTQDGLTRIDDPTIQGKQVLSFNEHSGKWEFKKVLRWLNQGTREILEIQTIHRKIRCTENHLIRTDQGWVAARDVKEETKILSPAPVDVAPSFTNLGQMVGSVALSVATNLKTTLTARSLTISARFSSKQNRSVLDASVDAEKNWTSPTSSSKKVEVSAAFSLTGKDIPSRKDTGIGNSGRPIFWQKQGVCQPKRTVSSTGLCWGMDQSVIPTDIADTLDWPGLMDQASKHGLNTRLLALQSCSPNFMQPLIRDTATNQSAAEQPVILPSRKFLNKSKEATTAKQSRSSGYLKSPKRDWHGGIWTMVPSASVPREVPKSSSTPKVIPTKRTNALPHGSPTWGILPKSEPTPTAEVVGSTSTLPWEQALLENGLPTCGSMGSHQWITNLETVVSVRPAGVEPVYDIEVEDNHNFVANGLLVHNCHMLSTAAFNALLKTLEEPPDNVVFVLATTDPQRVLPTIISRCQRFDYRRIPLEPMLAHLRTIATQEGIAINDEALRLVAQISQGGLRDAQSLLDQLSLLEPPIEAEAVWDLVGAVPERDLLALVQGIVSNNATTVLDQARKLMDRGREPLIVLQNLAGFYRDLLIAKTAGDRQDLVAITPPTWAEMQSLVQGIDAQWLLLGQQHLRSAEVQVKNTTQPRLWLEVTLFGLLPSALAGQVKAISASGHPLPVPTTAATSRPQPATLPQTPPPMAAPAQPVESSAPSAQGKTPKEAAADPNLSPPIPAQQASGPASKTVPAASAPPPEPPSYQQEAVDGMAEPNLNQLWQQVLAALQPLGTRALMQQQGTLLSFNGTVARIGISSKPLFKMAQGRVPNVEEAFQQVLQQKVTVSLEVLPDPKPEEPTPSSMAAPGTAAMPTAGAMPSLPEPPDLPEPSPAEPSLTAMAPHPVETSQHFNGNGNWAETETVLPSHGGQDTDISPSPLPVIATDFDRAVKNFAQFFNGQVVPMDDDLDALISGGREPSEAAAKQPSHPDKDVPF